MAFTIDLPPEVGRRVREQADRMSVTVEEFLRSLVEDALRQPIRTVMTGADLVEHWRQSGVIGAWAGRDNTTDSVACAEALRRAAEKR